MFLCFSFLWHGFSWLFYEKLPNYSILHEFSKKSIFGFFRPNPEEVQFLWASAFLLKTPRLVRRFNKSPHLLMFKILTLMITLKHLVFFAENRMSKSRLTMENEFFQNNYIGNFFVYYCTHAKSHKITWNHLKSRCFQ